MWICLSCKSENPDSATKTCQSCGDWKPISKNIEKPSFYSSNNQSSTFSSSSFADQMKYKPKKKIENYLSKNSIAKSLNLIGTAYIFVGIIVSIIAFFVVGYIYGDFNFLYGLLGFFIVLGGYILPTLLLKALASIVQNIENTFNAIRFKIDIDQDESDAK